MTLIKIKCEECGNLFERSNSEINRSKRKGLRSFCSGKCFGINHSKELKLKSPAPNVLCAWCGKQFYKNKSKLKLSKSGLYFCCRQHKDLAQRMDGLKELHLPHYGNGQFSDYRKLAKEKYGDTCCRCGFNKFPQILQVHHKDRNRTNNNISNLELLCPNCHQEDHFRNKDGLYNNLS
jgi:hypothetical protein